MAQKGIKQAVEEERLDLTLWAENMKKRLEANFETQKVWPRGFPGPYIGYRNTPGAKGSTGDALRTFYAKVYAGAGGDTEKISFFFRYYLYFVDMGVGAGQPIEDVDRSEKANWRTRYKDWAMEGDRQSRPVLSMELRWQLLRLETLVSSFYQEFIETTLITSFEKEAGAG